MKFFTQHNHSTMKQILFVDSITLGTQCIHNYMPKLSKHILGQRRKCDALNIQALFYVTQQETK
ncbi:CLUMA_CG016619, isoform A [Clunio marinus]|uniref:CLUMA_CG016619, isoform A n=1 Tax=Clunio marinus TaxID=568069 RepID=A0A1J1ISE5_9DIPT|nr:CLUMA_CG016619, isoform A [Clunio marinus]